MTASIKRSKAAIAVGVCGGSGSGKTYFARALRDELGADNCVILYQDSFYFDQSARFDHDGGAVNFDHPDSLDFEALASAVRRLKDGSEVDIPIYDFVTHSRRTEREHLGPVPVILIDGTLILHSAPVRAELDERIFFDTPETLRFARRLKRDVEERGRTEEGVRAQFVKQVKPMHDLFIEPSKRHASSVIQDFGEYESLLEKYLKMLRHRCAR